MNRYYKNVDILKGITILLVVLGHCTRNEMLVDSNFLLVMKNFIYMIHLPIFFFLSGFLYNQKKEKDPFFVFLKKKCKTLLIPFITYCLLLYCAFYIACFIPGIRTFALSSVVGLKEYMIDNLYKANPYSLHVWFIYILFLYMIITYLLKEICKIKVEYLSILALILLCISEIYYFKDASNAIIYFIPTSFCRYYIYYLCGMWIPFMKKRIIILLLPFVGLFFYNISSTLWYYDSLFIYIMSRIMIVAATMIMILGSEMLVSKIENKKITESLCRLGKQSMPIYLLHQPFFTGFVCMIFYQIFHLPDLLCVLLTFVSGLGIPLLIVMIIKKIPMIQKITKALLNIG